MCYTLNEIFVIGSRGTNCDSRVRSYLNETVWFRTIIKVLFQIIKLDAYYMQAVLDLVFTTNHFEFHLKWLINLRKHNNGCFRVCQQIVPNLMYVVSTDIASPFFHRYSFNKKILKSQYEIKIKPTLISIHHTLGLVNCD